MVQLFFQADSDRLSRLCAIDCGEGRRLPVCGTDNVSYRNKCELQQETVCKGNKNVRIKYRGECSDGNNSKNRLKRSTLSNGSHREDANQMFRLALGKGEVPKLNFFKKSRGSLLLRLASPSLTMS